jgi:hypothetical protein
VNSTRFLAVVSILLGVVLGVALINAGLQQWREADWVG